MDAPSPSDPEQPEQLRTDRTMARSHGFHGPPAAPPVTSEAVPLPQCSRRTPRLRILASYAVLVGMMNPTVVPSRDVAVCHPWVAEGSQRH
jgi:hypothetical protein